MTENIPQHVAIIMDGNGRWAERQGLLRTRGHQVGCERVEEIIRVAPKYGVRYLTLYAFSKENWQRPKHEVAFLMTLLGEYLDRKLPELMKNGVVIHAIGHLEDLPSEIQKKMAHAMEKTRQNKGLVTTFAFSYSSRLEITDACRKIAREVRDGKIQPEAITEKTIADHLDTAGLPDPDLLIRTSGEMRISNFLLWQISYTEIYLTEKYWPEFTEEELVKALEDYKRRERRFGRTVPVIPGVS